MLAWRRERSHWVGEQDSLMAKAGEALMFGSE